MVEATVVDCVLDVGKDVVVAVEFSVVIVEVIVVAVVVATESVVASVVVDSEVIADVKVPSEVNVVAVVVTSGLVLVHTFVVVTLEV